MQRRATLSGPQWVRKCAMFVRAMSLADMSGFLPRGEQLALKAQSTDNLESSGEPGTTANFKGKMSKRLSVVKGHFPKLVDCAHFHYENVDFGSIELQFANEQSDASWTLGSAKDLVFLVQVSCQGKTWMVRRSYEEFRTLDGHLHQCIYDRRYSQLLALPALCDIGERLEIFTPLLSEYLNRFSTIVDSKLNCGPVLSWMEIDNHGNRFLLKEEASLNIPAIAAAHVIKRYTAQASDEISIEVGDILSVIDMPPKEDTTWWRGKHGFQVGFFPSECVKLINEKLTQSVSAPVSKQEVDSLCSKPGVANTTGPSSPTSVSNKHGKLIGFLRTFMKSRPTKQKLKQRGILKERVFGCDLGEHLLNSGLDVPQVLKSCSDFIEKYGVVDGIYRHSGVSSNIQKLRHEFDSENVPDLTKDMYMQDIHCIGSLCKLYFRELPNPLLTYQLYEKFAECMGEMTEEERMAKIHDVIQQLPPPHYRTLEYLIRHLAGLATCSGETNMHIKNLAIVWAPNLLRSKEIEAAGLSAADSFKEVRIQSVVVEFLLSNVEVLFSDSFTSVGRFNTARQSLTRPKSFVSTRLLSLEEAQARTQAPLLLQGSPHVLKGQFHTVLDLPPDKRKRGMKVRKSAVGSWKTFFAIGKPAAAGQRETTRINSLFHPSTSHAGCRVDVVTLRSAKSEESLSSQHSGAGQGKTQQFRRPRSISDSLSMAASIDTQLLPQCSPSRIHPSRSYDSLLPGETCCADEEDDEREDEEGVYMLPDFSQEPSASWMAEDVIDFSPTFLEDGPIGLGNTGVTTSSPESAPSAAPPPYRCLSHQGHAHSGSQRPITEDPDSVLNQSEATARRSLILAAAAPPQQVFCQHKPSVVINPPATSALHGESNVNPSHSQTPASVISAPPSHPPQERRSFTRKVVHALSAKAPKSSPLDISDPIAISLPAKVLEMIGGRAGELQLGPPSSGPPQPPQMISMLLRSCDFQLTESCQQELSCILGPIGVLLPSQQPPPPPPKNPARLMALALAESANKALRQGASPSYRPRHSGTPTDTDVRFQRSLYTDAGDLLSSDPNQIYSKDNPLSVWRNEGDDDRRTATEKPAEISGLEARSPTGQDIGTLSSDSSVSNSVTSNSELSAASSSEDNERTPGPIYKNAETISPRQAQPSKSSPASSSDGQSQRKPPAYGCQFSSPQLQQQKSSTQAKPATQPHSKHLHSKSENSPLAQVRAFQPTRPKVPPKPPDLVPLKAPLSQTNRHDYMRRSLDANHIQRLVGPPQGNTPLSRAFSERISSTSDMLSHYHAARMASQATQAGHLPQQQQQAQSVQIRPVVPSSKDPTKMENLYYEIGAPEHPQVPPSYARHSYYNMKLDLEGNLRFSDPSNQRPVSRGQPPPYNAQGPGGVRALQLWSSEATRVWAAAHSHSFSFTHSHSHHCSEDGLSGQPHHLRPHRQTSSSVRLSRSEVYPIPSTAGVGSSVGMLPLSVHQRSLHHSQCLPSVDHTASQLHPYFENGKVCYRHFEASRLDDLPPNAVLKPNEAQPSRAFPEQGLTKDQPEPIYVNYPFVSPPAAGVNPKAWATTDLDVDDHQATETLAPPSEPPHDDKLKQSEQESPTIDFDSPAQNDALSNSKAVNIAVSTCSAMHFRSHSDPQKTSSEPSRVLTGKEIASLLIEKLAEDEREGPLVPASSTLFSSPHIKHPPNPYPSQQQQPPAYNVYIPGPSRGHFEGQMPQSEGSGAFQRQDPLRRSSGGQYRQAFDVMPSGDQVLKFYRNQDFILDDQEESTTPNPYPSKPYYQEPLYPNWGTQALPEATHTCTPPTVAFSNLVLGSTRGNKPQTVATLYNQYPYQSGPLLPHYPNTTQEDVVLDPSLRPPGLQNQSGLNQQESLPEPNWTIRTEGQTRSYC
ncbi:rho GTPase-activating protein 32-like isoform X2 [Xyrauchen texanus]|uniref:rho GTPase-activating protein 32-like isoform X2 n=1 Tax=Xyrauchen texanus TaxID=154827 RepID=UPI002241ED2A|nr:rho GTPase-activating protein 32-like isoform X2 [Xyrauchen texanus]